MVDQVHISCYTKVASVNEFITEAMIKSRKKGVEQICNPEIFRNIYIHALCHKFESIDDMKVRINLMVDKCRDTNGNITLIENSRLC